MLRRSQRLVSVTTAPDQWAVSGAPHGVGMDTNDTTTVTTPLQASSAPPPRGPRPPDPTPGHAGERTAFARLGAFTYRRRRSILVVSLLVVLAGFAAGEGLGDRLTAESPGSDRLESTRVAQRISDESTAGEEIHIVIDGIDTSAPDEAVIDRIGELASLEGVERVTDPWTTGNAALLATDGRAGLVVVGLSAEMDDDQNREVVASVTEMVTTLTESDAAGEVRVGGMVVAFEEFERQAEEDLARGELIALPIALIAMIFIFGGVRAAGMPIAIAIAAFSTSMIALLGASLVLDDMSVFSVNVVSLLGLGLGIDYGLILVSRFREERAHGLSVAGAVETTMATAGVSIVFSALTVAVAMSGMFVFGEPTMTSYGVGGLAAVLFSMVGALTLLPALLAVGGSKIKPMRDTASTAGRFYSLARLVQRFAVPVTAIIGVGLAVLAVPFLDARLENAGADSLPRSSESRAVVQTLEDRFPSRGSDPVTVVAEIDPTDTRAQSFTAELSARPDVAAVAPRPDFGDHLMVLDLYPPAGSPPAIAEEMVLDLRDQAAAQEFTVEVGGAVATTLDSRTLIAERMPYAVTIVMLATLVLLFLMTGSIAIPIKAIIMNIASLGASFGALVWIFQDGHLSGLLGFEPIGSIDLWMPVLMFLFAFGLSMDYEVFLLSRIKEIHDHTGDNDESVAIGLQKTGRIITSAALLIVVVFSGFTASELLPIKQLGLGMAIAVVVDAAIVRTLLVPATMKLLGRWNWWAPAPLRRVHQRIGLSDPPSASPPAHSPSSTSPPSTGMPNGPTSEPATDQPSRELVPS